MGSKSAAASFRTVVIVAEGKLTLLYDYMESFVRYATLQMMELLSICITWRSCRALFYLCVERTDTLFEQVVEVFDNV